MSVPSKLVLLRLIARELGVHLTSVHRWRLHGVRGEKLPMKLVGGRWFVDRDELADFLARLNAGHSRDAKPNVINEAYRREVEGELDGLP